MGRRPGWACLWPGLPQVAATGSWSGLAWAIGFAAGLNLLLLASLWWSEVIPGSARKAAWVAIVGFWIGSLLLEVVSSRGQGSRRRNPHEGPTLEQAVAYYLKGDWVETERLLVDLIGGNPRDVDAGLMLATVWRRAGRLDESAAQLDRLGRLDESSKWELEIQKERELIERARREPVAGGGPDESAAAEAA